MKSNVIKFGPPAAAAVDQREPLEAAVLEVSRSIAEETVRLRRKYSRADELGSGAPQLRRRHERVSTIDVSRPITFYSIDEADASSESGPLQAA
jgi:hypothetical protein